jgi:hypothetical protein
MLEVRITDPPSTDGATQTRSVTVATTPPDTDRPTVETVLAVDATQNGSFREIDSIRTAFADTDTRTHEFTTFIGVSPPYDLRAIARSDDTSTGETQRVTDTITLRDTSPPVESVGADDEPLSVAPPDEVRGGDATDVTPRIGPVEPITMTAEYQLPWQRDSNQTACGTTIQNQNGDLDWRIVFEGVLTLSQLDRLRSIRDQSGDVETRSAVFGVKRVTFDQLSVSRGDDRKVVETSNGTEPLYEFQLQTKELDDEEGLFGG